MALSLSFCIWKNHVILIVWSPLKRDAFKQSQYFESARTNYLVYEHSGTEDGNSTGFSSGYQVDSPIDTTSWLCNLLCTAETLIDSYGFFSRFFELIRGGPFHLEGDRVI